MFSARGLVHGGCLLVLGMLPLLSNRCLLSAVLTVVSILNLAAARSLQSQTDLDACATANCSV
eukprot:scaffold180476_cov31-Tisochrysis_lutea.AAC.1